MKKFSYITAVLFVLCGLWVGTSRAVVVYKVFCANGRLEIDSRSLEQMKTARGNNICVVAEFNSLQDAEKYAANNGGKGSPCNCQ